MAKQTINVGTSANDGTGDPNRTAFQKINANFTELYDGQDPANLISTDPDNAIELGTDGKLWSGGGVGSVGTLQQVTDNGNTTTNAIEVSNHIKASEFRSSADDITFADGSGNPIFFFASTGANQANFSKQYLTSDRNYEYPDASGTIALTSDIPTELSELTDDSAHRLVTDTQISTWDGKQDALTETNFGSFMNARTAKNTLVDADEVVSDDSADSNKAKKTTWLNVWTNYLKPKADALYQAILTDINFGAFSNSLSDKTTPVDADTINLVDSADSNKAKKLSFANLKAWILSFVPTVITSETGIYYFNDFLGVFTTSTNDGNISSDGNVAQTTTALNSDANKQGFANVNTSNATAGYGNIYIGHNATPNFILGGGVVSYETLIWLPSLSTSGERFSCLIGFSSGVLNQNNSANNIAFLYDEGNIAFGGGGGASANWRAVTTDTAVRTFTDTGIAVNAGAFIKLRIVVNANASSVEFFIDNTLVATHTTNIPSGNTKRLSVRNYIQKSVGSTTRLLILDYVKLQQTFTTAR